MSLLKPRQQRPSRFHGSRCQVLGASLGSTQNRNELTVRVGLSAAVFITLLLLMILNAPMAHAQRITVAIAFGKEEEDRLMEAVFRESLRALPDVDIITLEERPQYVVGGVVLCSPSDCKRATSYSVSLRLWSPFTIQDAQRIGFLLAPKGTSRERITWTDSIAKQWLFPLLRMYERNHMTWVASWGRERYELAARELVRKIDSECFEQSRLVNRAIATTDTTVSSVILKEVRSREWIC